LWFILRNKLGNSSTLTVGKNYETPVHAKCIKNRKEMTNSRTV